MNTLEDLAQAAARLAGVLQTDPAGGLDATHVACSALARQALGLVLPAPRSAPLQGTLGALSLDWAPVERAEAADGHPAAAGPSAARPASTRRRKRTPAKPGPAVEPGWSCGRCGHVNSDDARVCFECSYPR